jgi:hypothetical protein
MKEKGGARHAQRMGLTTNPPAHPPTQQEEDHDMRSEWG